MNLALPTLTLIFLLTPGLFFRRFYYTGSFSAQYFKSNFGDLLIATILPAVLIHVVMYYMIVRPDFRIETSTLATLMSGTDNSVDLQKAFSSIYYYASEVITYMLVACTAAAFSGRWCQWLVRRTNLDKRFKFFRFRNYWHYLFTGEILEFPGIPGSKQDISVIWIDVLIDTHAGSIIYSGYLVDYQLSKDGGIELFSLIRVKRRYLKDDTRSAGQYYYMPGEFFVITFDKVINLNITYYSIMSKDEVDTGSERPDPEALIEAW